MAPIMLETDLDIQDPMIDVTVSSFKADIRGNVNETVDIKGYRLRRVSNSPRRHWRHHCLKDGKATTEGSLLCVP